MEIAKLRFLVVEDHSFQRWMVGNLLQQLGASSVFLADDGNSALDVLAESDPPIDVVLTDLDMPGMDGMALIRRMGELKHPASLVVVSAMDKALVRGIETMADDFRVPLLGAIQKPVSTKKLEQVLSRHQAGGPLESSKPPAVFPHEVIDGLRDGHFETFFQPKVRMSDRKPTGAEALVRWRHPVHGLLNPGAFLAAVQERGVMASMTERVLKDALRSCAAWRAAGHEMTVSVNLAPASLDDADFGAHLVDLVGASGLQPADVIFEITESAAPNLGRQLETLTRLRMKGFGLSIDDYGTGHSSMERLSRVPFSELKIDQMFVRNIFSQTSNRAMLESSLHLASRLGIPAVAEGVENHVDWETLVSLGCPLAQGYHVSRPLPAYEFLSWLKVRRQACA